jgi:hypothetical protein
MDLAGDLDVSGEVFGEIHIGQSFFFRRSDFAGDLAGDVGAIFLY